MSKTSQAGEVLPLRFASAEELLVWNCYPSSQKVYEEGFFGFFWQLTVPMGFLPLETRVAFPGESQLWQSGATQPKVQAGCFSVFIIHGTGLKDL